MGNTSPRPLTKESQHSTTRNAALVMDTFQLCSWLARLLIATRRNNETISPSGRNVKPNSTMEPTMMARILKSNRSTSVFSAFLFRDDSKITAPRVAITTPSQNGKYPGPIRAAVPIE